MNINSLFIACFFELCLINQIFKWAIHLRFIIKRLETDQVQTCRRICDARANYSQVSSISLQGVPLALEACLFWGFLDAYDEM